MWDDFAPEEVDRREVALLAYEFAGVPDPSIALAAFYRSRGREAAAVGILNKFSLESDHPERGRFFFPGGRILSRKYGGVYGGFASHPLTPVEDLESFARDLNAETRQEVAFNPGAPGSILRQLVDDDDINVRHDALGNPSCPSAVLRANAWVIADGDDDDPLIGWGAIASNPSSPLDVLHTYILHADEALEDEDASEELEAFVSDVLVWVASNVSLDLPDVEHLAQHESAEVRAAIASNPIAPKATVLGLSHDDEVVVRENAALSLSLSPERLAELAVDVNYRVRAAVALNPNATDAARAEAELLGLNA